MNNYLMNMLVTQSDLRAFLYGMLVTLVLFLLLEVINWLRGE